MTARPNALIIGAGKAGSTSLHNYLSAHPEIAGSSPKELMYFTANYDNGVDWYQSHFPLREGVKIYFESTPQYSFRDEFPQVADRIKDYDPQMRIMYIVREPISRIVSHFNHWSRAYPDRYNDIEKSLQSPAHRKYFVERTRYFYQLSVYLDRFGPDQVKVVFLEDLKSRFEPSLNEVFAFLGVAPLARKVDTKIWNKRAEPTWKASDIRADLQDEIRTYLRDDVQRLFAHCGKDSDFWGEGYI